jgi:hypothetical protein
VAYDNCQQVCVDEQTNFHTDFILASR